jgi:trehalose 6-phosphate synthase
VSVVVVSNRVARPKPDAPIEGGLAAALLPAVKNAGAIWVGASGRLVDSGPKEHLVEVHPLGAGALATVDMPREHYDRYYEGFANSVLWPAFNSRIDLIRADIEDYASYREVNAYMARALLRFAKPDAAFWIHDYHFLTLAAEMRDRGVTQPIGFFLHTPFPGFSVMASIPHHRDVVRAMLAYDLIGFQTEGDLTNFKDYVARELALSIKGDVILGSGGQRTKLAAFPIGIDVKQFAEIATKSAARPEVSRLRASLQDRKLAIGVDRLDYSKGLPNRFRAFDRMFENYPNTRKAVSFLQIAVPTRVHIRAYQTLQSELNSLTGEINGRHAEVDWTPIRYLNKSFPQQVLAGFYRTAQVGIVTPLQDGMNLVAKEYVAAQNPLDPGVLVLSEFAGAAKQLTTALIVNPHDVDGMAAAIMQALSMSASERRERWNAMIACMEDSLLDDWFSDFVSTLTASGRSRSRTMIPTIVPAQPAKKIGLDAGTVAG